MKKFILLEALILLLLINLSFAFCCGDPLTNQCKCYGSGYCCHKVTKITCAVTSLSDCEICHWSPDPCLTCQRANPSLTIKPSTKTGSFGQTLIYEVEIKNNDNIACPLSTFTLSFVSCPSSFTCNLDSFSLKISPGKTSKTYARITSPSWGETGDYTFTIKVTNSASPSYTSQASAIYELGGLCDNDGICEEDETQQACPNDCKTIVHIEPYYVMPGSKVKLRVEFSDGRINCDEDFSLRIMINGREWLSEDSILHEKKFTEIGWLRRKGRWETLYELGKKWVERREFVREEERIVREEERIPISIHCDDYKIIATWEAFVPEDLGTGIYRIKVIPVVYSEPKKLNEGVTAIHVLPAIQRIIKTLERMWRFFIFSLF